MRRAVTVIVAVAVMLTLGLLRPAAAPAAGSVTFHVYDSAGRRITWSAFRALQENGKGTDGDNDMLLDPATLTVVKAWPLYSSAGATGDPTFTWSGRPVTLSLAWPTSDGYSNLLVDVSAPGVYNFGLLAADQTVAALDRAVSARPAYKPSSAFSTASNAAHTALSAAHSASGEASQGAQAAGLSSRPSTPTRSCSPNTACSTQRPTGRRSTRRSA